MKKLSVRGQKWLKAVHIYSGCVWIGCATVLSVMPYFVHPESDGELYGIQYTLDFIDLFILVPGAIGTFLTALIYSIWTNWGWFKHNWITVKWVICLFFCNAVVIVRPEAGQKAFFSKGPVDHGKNSDRGSGGHRRGGQRLHR